jgi:phenylacetate-CoA ligase
MTDYTKLEASFKYAATNLSYYQTILKDREVNPDGVTDAESFFQLVPVIDKQDVFPPFNADHLFTPNQLDSFVSAIVSSGTSGVFSYGLVTKESAETQSQMLDHMIAEFFSVKEEDRVIIINALPMGVSFTSSHPVIPVSTRTDIALHVIKTFGKDRQVIIITEPRLMRQLVEQGEEDGVNWSEYKVSAVIGGMWFPDSLTKYLVSKLNGGQVSETGLSKNQVLTTMGITEVGLNLFTGTPDLIALRSTIQNNQELSNKLFSTKLSTPVLGYALNSNIYLEIINQDEHGVGELVVTHLDEKAAPLLVRYNTGDMVKLMTKEELEEINFKPHIPAPVFAIYGRSGDQSGGDLQSSDIQQMYYQTDELVRSGTDNFHLDNSEGKLVVYYQLKPNLEASEAIEINNITFKAVTHFDYKSNMGPLFDYKWKH